MDDLNEKQNRDSREYYYSSDAEYERRGMPQSFKEDGYAQRRHELRANLLIIREHLQDAMRAGLNSEALRHVIAAIRELERN